MRCARKIFWPSKMEKNDFSMKNTIERANMIYSVKASNVLFRKY
jgi:hypothetical protein